MYIEQMRRYIWNGTWAIEMRYRHLPHPTLLLHERPPSALPTASLLGYRRSTKQVTQAWKQYSLLLQLGQRRQMSLARSVLAAKP